MAGRTWNRVRRALSGRSLPVWYHAEYRLPLPALENTLGLEPRRADHVIWTLLELGAVDRAEIHTPERVSYEDLCRVHTPRWLEALGRPETFIDVFGVPALEIDVDAVMGLFRLAVGGTLEAAREALRRRGPTFNLQGGFHHAFPDKGGGLCALNDVAVAVAALRAEGFGGRVVVLDLDAHPPDGTAACMARDPAAWIGSISGSDWGDLPGVDEVLLEPGSGGAAYLEALDGLLGRMPPPELAFVIAGADVLAGDRMGRLALGLADVRARDLRVASALRGIPAVWLPGGGYSRAAWRALAGTGMALALGSEAPLPEELDPLSSRMNAVFSSLQIEQLGSSELELEPADLGLAERGGVHRLLGVYTAEGIEFGLHSYGVLPQILRLGYRDLRVALDRTDVGERFRLFGRAGPEEPEHLLVEAVLERQRVPCPLTPGLEGSGPEGGGVPVLYVHWLTLRNPRASFTARRPALPGQDAPGLGLAPEAGELLGRIALRLGLAGVALRPAWFHVAYASRARFRFVDPARQGRFEALIRDLASRPLLEATRLVAEGRVRLNGEPYSWEPELMVSWKVPVPTDEEAVARAREAAHFTVQS